MKKYSFALGAVLFFTACLSTRAGNVALIKLDKPIHPITTEYVVGAIKTANATGADLILLEIDTPGGYVDSVQKIQKAIYASKAPVAAWVAPSGARAASGGAYIAISCDVLAMAPGTNIGAAHPVSMLPIPSAPQEPPSGKKGENGNEKAANERSASVEMEKIVNDLSANIRSVAQNRGRNAKVAEEMVRNSISLSEKEALNQGLIDLVAPNEFDIFKWLKGRPVKRLDGREQTLDIGEAPTVTLIGMSPREKFLSGLANPTLAFLLLVLGALGLFVEFKNPGLIFPGVLGAIFILLFLVSTPILPVNVVGLLLVILGLVFFILEVKVVSYGMLTVGGVVSLIIGSMMLYDKAPIPELQLSLRVVLPVILAFSAIIIILLYLVARTMKSPVKTGEEGLVGKEGVVRKTITPSEAGKVFVFGEYWNATSDVTIEEGTRVRVTNHHGMMLVVVPLYKGVKDVSL